ncbi:MULTISPECIES: ATP-dependent endonuclease [Acidianus]|uniref:ATPase n=1 Tax=Candidatus Acidianus copahuensis TaxID=1160895 RepID=A0A031LKR9_9CREN|nr:MULTISPECIES: ATP/GTP-binding protein [Acidianus]EZQ02090.1 ATPase [Candidatus Acidianus copahuensis]NON63559.1 AAA family ATPase [Acidianus sp. RZ1]
MRLTEFYTNNFRSLSEINVKELGGLNLIVGFNGYGKTNFLSAIYLLIKNLSAGIEKRTVDDRNQELMLLWQGYDTSKEIILGGKFVFSEKEVLKIIGKSKDMEVEVRNRLKYERGEVNWNLDLLKVNGSVPMKDDIEDVRKLFDSASSQVEYVPIFDQNYFDDVMKRIVEISRSPINLRKYWYDFVNLVSATIPEIKGLEIWDGGKLVLNVYNLPIYIDLAASGFQRVILMLFVIWLSGNKILLLEEPEVNMHPTLQYKLIKLLRSWTDNGLLQVFMTTHSPFIVSSPVDNYIVLKRNTEFSTAMNVKLDEDTLSLLSILKVNLSDLLFTKHVILTSDAFEPEALNNLLRKLGISVEYSGIYINSINNDLELQAWQKLREMLKLDVTFMGLCDKVDIKEQCIPISREMEAYYSKSGIIEALRRLNIFPDEKELRDLGKDENMRWISNILRKRGLDYLQLRGSIGDIVTRVDSVELPKEVELLANKIKSLQAYN